MLNDSKYGWDKPADNVLRLTLLHTALPRAAPYQGSNDLGHHRFTYSIAGHRGDWRDGRVPERAARLNQPIVAFQATPHPGARGPAISMLSLDDTTGQIAVAAMKKAEDSDEIVRAVPGEVRTRRPRARDDAWPDRVGARDQRGRRGRRPADVRTATP